MVAGGYYIDQGVVLAFYFAAFVGFALQLAVEWKILSHEKKQAEAERKMYHIKFKSARAGNSKLRVLRVGKLQYFFHRIGFLACLLQLIRYIDPYGAYGYYNLQAINFFAYNISALIIIALAGAFYLPIDLVYVVSLSHAPPASLKWMFAFSGFLTVVDANVSLVTRERWCTGLFLVWIAAIQFFQVVLFDIAMWQLTRAINEMKWKGSGPTNNVYEDEARSPRDRKPSSHNTEITEDSTEDTLATGSPTNSSMASPRRVARKKEDSLERALYHMHVFQVVANIGVAMGLAGELGIGVPLLLKDPREDVDLRDPEKYSLSGTLLYVVLQFGAIIIMLWYSYLDVSVLWAKDDEAADELAELPPTPANANANPLGKRMPSNSQRGPGHQATASNSNLSKITTRDLADGNESTDSPGVSRQPSQEFANLAPARSTDQLLAV